MADYSLQIEELKAAAEICKRHVIKEPINGIQPEYPRWSNAWDACEVVWRNYLEMKTLASEDEEDRRTVIYEAYKLR